ncbi:MAG: thiaminase II [Bacteroidetes bacterium]|nr:MAG: thiaminase II [Bacteroidota bacterium]
MTLTDAASLSPAPTFQVPPFAARCLSSAESVWRDSFEHPFVKGLIDGSLDPQKFRFYQMQDARYLEAYADVCSIISTRVVDPSEKLWFIEGARMAIIVERALHENYGKKIGYSADDIAGLKLSPNNRAYQNHMLAAANHGTVLEALAALAPCPWLYADIGQEIISSGSAPSDSHPFKDWIDEYADPIFVEYTNQLLAYMQSYADNSSDEDEKERAVELFCLSARYEHLFWDQAWTGQTWPDEVRAEAAIE